MTTNSMNGWMRRKATVERSPAGRAANAGAGLLLALTLSVPAAAAEDQVADPPDEALLLFLADWADADGTWEDPFAYEPPPQDETEPLQVIDDEDSNNP